MGWRFRRSVGFGPLRINLSKSGVGVSAGIRGIRIGRDSRGRDYSHLSIPGTGIYRRDYFSRGGPFLTWISAFLFPAGLTIAVLILLVLYLLMKA